MSVAFKNLLRCINHVLQETHLEDKDNSTLQMSWVGQVFATSYSSFSRDVATLISKKLAFRSLKCVKDNQDHYVFVKEILAGKEVTFITFIVPRFTLLTSSVKLLPCL